MSGLRHYFCERDDVKYVGTGKSKIKNLTMHKVYRVIMVDIYSILVKNDKSKEWTMPV